MEYGSPHGSPMRHALLLTSLLTAATLAFIACGGSSSETPWPAEPDKVVEPEAEATPVGSTPVNLDAGTPPRRQR
jgi:hypothetical protein